MTKRLLAMVFGLCVASVAGAVNDPDATGRSVKYLDVMNSAIVSYYTPTSQCFQFAPSAPNPTQPITCVALAGAGSLEPLPVINFGEIAIAANESHSLLSFNMQAVADYTLNNPNASRSTLILIAVVKVSIESSMLNDPSLINPRTGQPFNGKVDMNYQWIYDMRATEPGANFAVATKLPFETTILSRKMLTSGYGLSATRAALVFARPMTVKVSITGNFLGNGRANFFVGGRLFGD